MNDEDEVTAEVVEADAPTEDTATSKPVDDAESKAEADSDSGSEEKRKDQTEKKPRRNRRSESQRIAQLTAQLRERERQLEAQKVKAETPAPNAPKRDDFDDYEDYIEAKAEHKAIQVAEKRAEELERQFQERDAQAQADRAQIHAESARESLISQGIEKHPDFEEVTNHSDLHISEVMAEEILASETGDAVWYHLGKNRDEAERIFNLNPRAQIRALSKLETQLAGGKIASNAPPPTKPVNTRGSSNNGLSDKMSTAEWMRKRTEEARKNSF